MIIDLRSDTLTQPTPAMRAAMMDARVGDDVYGEDPTVNELQTRLAAFLGMDRALFCPSGTMCNQIAIRLATRPQDQVICDQYSHIYLYEGGGIAAHSSASVRLIKGARGKISPAQILTNINPPDQHFPVSKLVSIENTHNKGGGSVYSLQEIAAISQVCKAHQLSLHLDGARLFNGLVAADELTRAAEYGQHFDTISVCLSKGLGAPVGSVLLYKEAQHFDALRYRKMMGGGMRQSGFLAAAGLYALDHHVDRLKEDHQRARIIAKELSQLEWVKNVMEVETNIIGFEPDTRFHSLEKILGQLAEQQILAAPFGGGYLRFVTHLDVDDAMLEKLLFTLKSMR